MQLRSWSWLRHPVHFIRIPGYPTTRLHSSLSPRLPRHDGNHNNGTQFNSIAYRKEISVAAICASRLLALPTWVPDSVHLPTYVLKLESRSRRKGRSSAGHCRPVKWVTLTAAQMTIAGQQILGNCCSCWSGLNAYALTE